MPHKPHPDDVGPYATDFGDLSTVDRTNVIDINSSFPLSQQVNVTDATTASASVTQVTGEYQLSTSANTNQVAQLDTARRGRYTPGYISVVGMGVRDPAAPTGNVEERWGYFDDNDGVYFGRDSTGLYVERLKGGARQGKVRQTDWNVDTLDGSGGSKNPSGVTLDPADGHIYRIPHSLYGYGEFRFQVLVTGENGLFPVSVHNLKAGGEVSLEDWNLPIRAKVETNGTAASKDLFVGGRQYSLRGQFTAQRRIKSERVLDASLSGTTWVPVLSFRKKSGRTSTPVDFTAFELISSDNLLIELRSNATLSDASFGTPSDVDSSETAVESDVFDTGTNTTIDRSTGFQRWQGLHVGGQGGQERASTSQLIESSVKNNDPVSLVMRKVSGSGGTVTAIIRWEEQW